MKFWALKQTDTKRSAIKFRSSWCRIRIMMESAQLAYLEVTGPLSFASSYFFVKPYLCRIRTCTCLNKLQNLNLNEINSKYRWILKTSVTSDHDLKIDRKLKTNPMKISFKKYWYTLKCPKPGNKHNYQSLPEIELKTSSFVVRFYNCLAIRSSLFALWLHHASWLKLYIHK